MRRFICLTAWSRVHELPPPTSSCFSVSSMSWKLPKKLLLGLALAAGAVAVAHAAGPVVPFADSFEGTSVYPYWKVGQVFGTVSLSTDRAYAGSHSLKFTSASGGNRGITLTHSFGALTKGAISVAFYDVAPGQETLYEQLILTNSQNSAVSASVGTMDFDSECYEARFGPNSGPNANCGIYPQETTTPVKRAAGWHILSISFGQYNVSISIDGRPVYTIWGNYQFDTAQLSVTGPSWRPDTVAYFDDFKFIPLSF
jgi:hypothetical protein